MAVEVYSFQLLMVAAEGQEVLGEFPWPLLAVVVRAAMAE